MSKQEVRLQLDGRLAGQWVCLLRESAESVLDEGLTLTIDLKNIFFIDCAGIELLKSLIKRGVDPINAPLFVAEEIKRCKDSHG